MFNLIAEKTVAYGDVVYAVWIVLATIVVATGAFYIFRNYVLGIKRGKNDLHEHLASEVKLPFYLMAAVIGGYYALKSINILIPYQSTLKDVFVVVGVLLGAYITRRAVNTLIVWYANKDQKRFKIEQTSLMSLRNLISIFIFAIAAMIILSQFGVEITPLLASLGIGGLAIALALQPTLSNYFSSLYIASDKTIRLGDYIEIDGDKRGYVEKMTWRTVWIKTITNNMVIIPNSKLAEATIINYDQPKQDMTLWVDLGVAYSSDLDKVEKVAIRVAKKVAKETDTIAEGNDPYVRFKEFGDSNIKLVVLFRIREYTKQFELKDEFIKALKKEFDKEGIEISFPARNLYMRKGTLK
jgi:small-conductance mechanosensitive channel